MGKKNMLRLFIPVLFAVFLIFTFDMSNGLFADSKVHYSLLFTNIGTLDKGASVKQAGVNIGEVYSIASKMIMKPTPTYYVVVDIGINEQAQVSYDSTASIYTLGMMGEQYIELSIGYLEKVPEGAMIEGHGPQQIDKVIEQSAQALSTD
jgi:phospholipid/cholesterol/gamma-HCH transport system substrate-binding protein